MTMRTVLQCIGDTDNLIGCWWLADCKLRCVGWSWRIGLRRACDWLTSSLPPCRTEGRWWRACRPCNRHPNGKNWFCDDDSMCLRGLRSCFESFFENLILFTYNIVWSQVNHVIEKKVINQTFFQFFSGFLYKKRKNIDDDDQYGRKCFSCTLKTSSLTIFPCSIDHLLFSLFFVLYSPNFHATHAIL